MKKVFYIECSGPIWRDIAVRCQEQAQWLPVLWTASHADAEPVRSIVPEAMFIAGTDAALGIPAPPATWPEVTLDAPLLQALAFDESIALHMMDRMDPRCGTGFSHDERRRHYHQLLRYWIAAIEALKPHLIVFSISPHVVFDYVILALARHRSIPTVMFERPGLPGWVFPMTDFRSGSTRLQESLRRQPTLPPATREAQLPRAFLDWLQASSQGAAAMPANYQRKLDRYKMRSASQMPSLTRAVLHELKRAAVLWRRNGSAPAPNSYLRSMRFPHGRCGPLETLVARLRGVQKKRQLMHAHDSLSSPAADGEKYVFLALHYQPERATVPMGGAFGDQTLIVRLLAACLPAGWKLYVKEHPWQLQSFGRGEVQRSRAFYADITSSSAVRLLPRDASTAEMVRNARAVATVTGSVGWDALCCGIPVLLFGAAWYKPCHGVHAISDLADLRAAMQAVQQESGPDLDQIAAFCAALASVCVAGTLEPELESIGGLSADDAAAAMSAALIGHQAEAAGN